MISTILRLRLAFRIRSDRMRISMEIKVPKVSWALHATAKSIWTVCVKTEMSKDMLLQCDWSDIHMPCSDVKFRLEE